MKYIKLSKRIFNQSVRLEESIITIFCTGKGVMECETSVMVSEENSKEEDDLLLQSIRKVKRKANEKEIPLEREVEYKKIGGEENYPYKEKFLSSEGAIPFSAFDGGCYGMPNKDILPSPISKEDKERFQEVPISDKEFIDWCKP